MQDLQPHFIPRVINQANHTKKESTVRKIASVVILFTMLLAMVKYPLCDEWTNNRPFS